MHPHAQGEAPWTGVGRGEGDEGSKVLGRILVVPAHLASKHWREATRDP